jgi:hypothetical protein
MNRENELREAAHKALRFRLEPRSHKAPAEMTDAELEVEVARLGYNLPRPADMTDAEIEQELSELEGGNHGQ